MIGYLKLRANVKYQTGILYSGNPYSNCNLDVSAQMKFYSGAAANLKSFVHVICFTKGGTFLDVRITSVAGRVAQDDGRRLR